MTYVEKLFTSEHLSIEHVCRFLNLPVVFNIECGIVTKI